MYIDIKYNVIFLIRIKKIFKITRYFGVPRSRNCEGINKVLEAKRGIRVQDFGCGLPFGKSRL